MGRPLRRPSRPFPPPQPRRSRERASGRLGQEPGALAWQALTSTVARGIIPPAQAQSQFPPLQK